jgi:hypothetical protein
MEMAATDEYIDDRRPEDSLLRVGEHLAQLAMHCGESFGYQQLQPVAPGSDRLPASVRQVDTRAAGGLAVGGEDGAWLMSDPPGRLAPC